MTRQFIFQSVVYPQPQHLYKLSCYLTDLILESEHACRLLCKRSNNEIIEAICAKSSSHIDLQFKLDSIASKYQKGLLYGDPKGFRIDTRTQNEIEAFNGTITDIRKLDRCSFSWFTGLLETLSSYFNGENGKIRRNHNVGTHPDANGGSCIFIHYQDVINELKKLHCFITDRNSFPCHYTASIVIGALLTIHPFRDANGRLSRIIYNLLLNRNNKESKPYIPIKQLVLLSRGSFELNIREANISRRWTPLIAYMCSLTILTTSTLEKGFLEQSVLRRLAD